MFSSATPGKVILFGLILAGVAYGDTHHKSSKRRPNESGPPDRVCSHDNKYCVSIIPTAGHSDECTLRVLAGGNKLAEFRTMGYLLGAFFSPNNEYVAINNRRANSGDYLWVISLRDGNAIKMPDDAADDSNKKDLGKITGDHWSDQSWPDVLAVCPTCTSEHLQHSFLFSTGWTSSGQLKVVEELEFSNGWVAVNHLCRLIGTGLSVADEKVVKEDHPSAVVKRAWTWSPFHTE